MTKGGAEGDYNRTQTPEVTVTPEQVDTSSSDQKSAAVHKKSDEKSSECLLQFIDHSMSNEKQLQSRQDTSSPQSLVHEIHTHPHRRHFSHHLLDHFSRDTDQDFASTTPLNTIHPTGNRDLLESSNIKTAVGSNQRVEISEAEADGLPPTLVSLDSNNSLERARNSQANNVEENRPWPFFGTESRILPSGRRVSFLKQACWAFSSVTHNKDNENLQSMSLVCPRAYRAPAVPLRRPTPSGSRKNIEIKASTRENSESKAVDLQKFKNESVDGPSFDFQREDMPPLQDMRTRTSIIDSSSTKGKHPVPKAPGILLASGSKVKMSKLSHPARGVLKKSVKSTPTSQARQRHSPSTNIEASADDKDKFRPIIRKGPPRNTEVSSKNISKPNLSTERRTNNFKNRNGKKVEQRHGKQQLDGRSSESCEDSRSLIDEGNDSTNTYEELSVDSSDLSDRNFLIDYGDPSKFYFRNEWNSKMHNLNIKTASIREKIEQVVDGEVYLGAVDIVNDVERMKVEMAELYDYFDHFEREEDTLLQQVQRQLNQANRYCRILHYRLDKAAKHKVDKNRIEELEEELKLSRQVAVSLHWELRTVDEKQWKLEKENHSLRHQVAALETAKEALSLQTTKLQHNIDQMSLHAPSRTVISENSDGCPSSDSTSEIKRQLQFMDEKETVLIARLVDLQKERDSLKDILDRYQDSYGELPSTPAPGANRQTDLKLRLKLAEDQSGLLARKVIEMQLENENMIKMIEEKEFAAKEEVKRNPSISDLQFLEDERESLRLALDEMEIENQRLAAELLRYKQAVHRQLHSNSISTDSSMDVGIVLRVPRSNESVFEEDSSPSRSQQESSGEKLFMNEESYRADVQRERNILRPLSLTSPSSHSLSRNHSLSRTLSDIAIPLSPDTKHQSMQITPTKGNGTLDTARSKSSSMTSKRKILCQKCKKSTWIKYVDVAVVTDTQRPNTLQFDSMKSIGLSTSDMSMPQHNDSQEKSLGTFQEKFKDVIDVATQIRERHKLTNSIATSPIKIDASTPVMSATISQLRNVSPRPHSILLEEMRKQLANVRNIAESMDHVVIIDEIDVEMTRRGRDILDAESKRTNEGGSQRKKISKLAKSLQKYIREMEVSVSDESDRSDIAGCHSSNIIDWNLHGNTDLKPITTITTTTTENDLSTLKEQSTAEETEPYSLLSVRSLTSKFRRSATNPIGLKVIDAVVMLVVLYILVTSLPSSALFQVCFLLLLFFVW